MFEDYLIVFTDQIAIPEKISGLHSGNAKQDSGNYAIFTRFSLTFWLLPFFNV